MIEKCMMILAASAILMGCSSKVTFGINMGRVQETREGIETAIADPARRAEMQAVVDAYIAEAEAIADEVKALRTEIVRKNRDYDTTRWELEELYNEIEQQLERLVATAAEHAAEMRTLCSEEEWEQIFGHDGDMLNFTY